MAEGTYEYECMRAELLGLAKPTYDEFIEKQKEKQEAQEEELEEALLEEAEHQNENLKNVTGGLEELNSILSITQRKLNRFKNACGSLTNLLKLKVGQGSADSPQEKPQEENGENADGQDKEGPKSPTENGTENPNEPTVQQNGETARKSDLAKALDSQVDKLDSLIYKAENAQYSMAHQTKQMKSFLK